MAWTVWEGRSWDACGGGDFHHPQTKRNMCGPGYPTRVENRLVVNRTASCSQMLNFETSKRYLNAKDTHRFSRLEAFQKKERTHNSKFQSFAKVACESSGSSRNSHLGIPRTRAPSICEEPAGIFGLQVSIF